MSRPLSETDRDGVRMLRLERPERLNALSTALRLALVDAMNRAAEDEAVRAILLTGAGERGFCAGQDIKESSTLQSSDTDEWMETWDSFFQAFLTFPKPIVSAVNGVAAGGGLDLALFGDVRVAVTDARFIMAEIDIGLPVICGSFLLAQDVFWSRALGIVLTGQTIPAAEALRIGMIHEVVQHERLLPRAFERAGELAAKPPVALRLTIQRLRQMRLNALNAHGVFKAMPRYHGEAIASGEPQRVMEKFLARKNHPRLA
ncbi:MAG: enoyl-CoA hydratase/isomerase family protein [Proteobacteria bacterium]|nr:enoyl-CoA hydratase/isomerase family protein [Pseudomonadota bacterium]